VFVQFKDDPDSFMLEVLDKEGLDTTMRIPVFALLLIAMAYGQQTSVDRTGNLFNGRAWKSWDAGHDLARSGYLIGVAEATKTVKCISKNEELSPEFPFVLRPVEIIEALNRFYDDPENMPIPIRWALHIVSLKVNGKTSEEIHATIERLRRSVSLLEKGER
jgi:hypothetical protein